MQEERFDQWAIVEIMGHQRYAGRVTEQAIGGCAFVRIDVPEIPGDAHRDLGGVIPPLQRPAFTKLFGQGSIFCITPCSEEAAREAARRFMNVPLSVVDLTPRTAAIPQWKDSDDDDWEDIDSDDDIPM